MLKLTVVMYPENNPQPQPPPDYLNQIAPKPPKKMLFPQNKAVVMGTIIIGVILLFIIIGIIANISSNNNSDTERLAARILTTQSIVNSAQTNLKDSQLRGINSSLSLYLANTLVEATPILAKQNININKLNKNVISAESGTKTLATLNDARLNGIYDRIYASEMANQLENTIILMQKIYKNTNSSSLKSFLSSTYQNLQPTQKQFANFNADD
jgi:hypothetical protein